MSETWYRTTRGSIRIEPIEVERSTEKSVFVRDPFGFGTPRARATVDRCAITSEYFQFHRTWDDAKAFLLQQQEEKVISLRAQLDSANGKLGNIKGLKKP
jgi:hypothetical protein